jgi:PAS domain S-box-containing protein
MDKQTPNKYYSLFNQIADPIFIFEKETSRILDCNQSVSRIYGYTPDEIRKMTFFNLHPPTELERVKKAIKIVNKDVPFTFSHFKKNGVKIIVEILSDRIDYEGKPATISIVRDVSDRVKIEKELERKATQTALIYEVGRRFSSYLNLESVLTEIVNSINDMFKFFGVMLLLLNERKNRLELQSIAGGYATVFPSKLSIKMGEGMIGQAAKERKIQLSGDVTANPYYIKKAEEVTISELSVPIIKNEKLIGVLDFQSDKKNAFDRSDVELAQTLSSQIATAIENARLYEKAQAEIEYSKKLETEAKRRATQFSLLYQIGQKVSSELDLENLLQAIVVSIRDAFDYYGVMLLSLDNDTKSLRMQSIAGAYAGVFPVDMTINLGEGMIGQAALTQQTQLSNDITQNPLYPKNVKELTRSELSIPIMKGNSVIGVLDIQSDKVHAFDESDVTAAETLSSQIAGAIENARLYNQAQAEIEDRLRAEKELRKSRNSLRSAKKQTDIILQNVDEGFFLLDKKFRIGMEYSAALKNILEIDEPANTFLPDILKTMLSEEMTENIRDFLDLMFNPSIDEESLADLNPLTEANVTIRKETELFSKEKVLSFKFQRILNEQEIIGLIATVNDITEQARLARKLKETEEQSKSQIEWFMGILHVEPQLLKEFIDSANYELNQIEESFKSYQNEPDIESLVDGIYRSVHMIKGNASLLDLKFFANRAHIFEEKIEQIKKKKEKTVKDFIPLVMQQNELRKNIGEINKMIERISQLHAHFRPKRSFENQLLINSIKNLIHSLSKDLKKEVDFLHDKFDLDILPYEYRLLVKDLMIQMVRNSVTHGIECPEERMKLKKTARGQIKIDNFLENGHFCFRFRDDGRGLQLKKIREKAENAGKWTKKEIAKWDDQQIAALIFLPGITTVNHSDLLAGRGVGMDIIKQKVESHNGEIVMNFHEGEFFELIVRLPAVTNR